MKTFLKFTGGLALGAALGVGIYLLVTNNGENGFVQDIKEGINQAIEEGKRSAIERRRQLEAELGFSIDDNTPPHIQTQPPAAPLQ